MIDAARTRAVTAVNTTLIDLYWSIGEFISRKVAGEGWGQGTVEELAACIRWRQPNARGFSARNLWRMMQFFQTYDNLPKLSPVVAELYTDAASVFKDSYLVEFLNLPKDHSETDLHHGLVERLKEFLLELGRDFCFVDSVSRRARESGRKTNPK